MQNNETSSILLKIQSTNEENKTMKNNFTKLFLTLIIASLLVVGAACNNYGTRLEFNGGEIYYTKNSNESDAKKLGQYLIEKGFFNGTEKSVQLDKSGSTNQVRIVIQPGQENDEKLAETLKNLARELSGEVFGGAPTEIHLCDNTLKTLKVVKP
ncbi:hypothetical protein BH10ACI1_BH10ACI1_25710 [soil metagenome]